MKKVYAANISDERKEILRKLKKKGDKIIFPMDLYEKVTSINKELNIDARIDRHIKREEVMYSMRKLNEKQFCVMRVR